MFLFFFRFLPWRFLLSSILLHEVKQMWTFHKGVQLLALLLTLLGCFFFLPFPKKQKMRCVTQSTVFASYGWWTKSCTTKDDEYPIIYRVLTIPGGAGFCPSTVCLLGSRCCWPSEPFRQLTELQGVDGRCSPSRPLKLVRCLLGCPCYLATRLVHPNISRL